MERSRSNLTLLSLVPALALLVSLFAGVHAARAGEAAAPDVDLPEAEAPAEAPVTEAPAETEPAGAEVKTGGKLEDDFSNYLHFAMVGQFDVADRYGQSLLQRPELNPLTDEAAAELLALSEKYRNSIETLMLMINNTPIAENAAKVLALIRQSHARARMAPNRIVENIKLLGGSPMQQAVGLERLVESGEYAIPWMLDVLKDPGQSRLHPFVVRALPAIGQRALNPLIEALQIDNAAVQGAVAQTLGRIGYPQALPYLQRLAADQRANSAVRAAAEEAATQVVVPDPSVKRLSAAELFRDLAEKYYANTESIRPDPREPRANVWFLRDGLLQPVEVPREIYMYVLCMRTSEASLALNREQPQVVALWLAANFHREAALGLEVTSEETAESNDLTRPPNFPRSIYFARTAGPMHCQLALSRAMRDADSIVALGSIAALHATAGPATLVEPAAREGTSLAAALAFPDLLVRIRAALALGEALPQRPFRNSSDVVPVLASALQLTGRHAYIVVDPDDASRDRLAGELTRAGAEVVAEARFEGAIEAARKQFSHLDGVFLASDMTRPTPAEAVRALSRDTRFALAPTVVVVKPEGNAVIERVAQVDPRVGHVFVEAQGGAEGQLAERALSRLAEVAQRFGAREFSPELSVDLALQAARALHQIAVNRSPVYDIAAAESSLILALTHPTEELRVAVLRALALINSDPAQRSIATVAMNPDQTESLRLAAFDALAESARRFGTKLEDVSMQRLFEQATREANLTLRTAASQALGATNPPGGPVAEIILKQ